MMAFTGDIIVVEEQADMELFYDVASSDMSKTQ